MNCQSIFAKKPTFEYLLHQHNPDFIAGSESWLTQSINTNEIFPSIYTIYRRDRLDGYGGVFLGCKSTFISKEIPLKTLLVELLSTFCALFDKNMKLGT